MKRLFVDNFAGGGGASTGIEMAIGRSVDIAINHDPDAIAMLWQSTRNPKMRSGSAAGSAISWSTGSLNPVTTAPRRRAPVFT